MEVTNTFDGGMKRDYSPSNQPQKSYTYCLNGINISDAGDIFSLSNERGTTNRVTNFPTGFKIIGGYVLDSDLIVCLVNSSGPYSQIGIIDANFSYTRIAPNSDTNQDLGFLITNQVDCQARKLFTGDRILYYTDNNVAIGFLNLDNPPASLSGNVSLFPEFQMPIVDFVNISEDGGNLHAGVYQFTARYKTAEFNSTAFGFVSNVIPIVDEKRSVGRNAYDGAYPDYPITIGKSINIIISNLDVDYPYLEIVVSRYDGQQNELVVQALPLLNISGNTSLTYTYTGSETDSVVLTNEEVTATPIVYNTAKCVEQKDSRIIFSNLGTTTEIEGLQEIANNIIVKYTIEEIEYLDGISGITTGLAFDTAKPPYIIEDDAFVIYIKFTGQVDSTTAIDVTNYEINYDPSNSAAYAAGPDYLLDDTVTNTNNLYICIQAAGSGANAPSGTTADNTWWQYVSPYIINPTSAEIDADDSSLVILTMDSDVPSQSIDAGVELEIIGVNNYANTSTINTTETVVSDPGTTNTVDGYFNDYKNEERTYNLKGYMREEVYSLGIGVVYKDGTRSFSYHIPGSDHTTAFSTAANTASFELGTYLSTADYPLNQGHIGGKVRHHKMPTLIQEPHFRVDATTGRTYIRVLGLDFTNVIIPAGTQSQIERVFFTRQSRNSSQNRSILSQGIVNNLVRIGTEFDPSNGSVDTDSRVYKKVPFFNNFSLTQTDVTGTVGTPDSAVFDFNTPEANAGAFFSPDTTLLNKDISEFAKIKNVLTLTGGINRTFLPSENNNNNKVLRQVFQIKRPLTAWLFGNYTNYEIPASQTSLDVDQKKFINALDKKIESTFFTDYPIDNSISGKFLAIKTSGTIPNGNPNTLNLNLRMNATINSPQVGSVTQINYDALNGSDIIKNYLFNIYKDNSQQYGELNASEYILIHSTSSVALTTHDSIFNGDTFISKFGVGNKDNYQYKPLHYTVSVGVPNATYKIGDLFEPRVSGYEPQGLDLRTLSYFFVESTVNVNYRHQFNDGITSGVKYFPKYTKDEVLLEDPRNGDATSYNTQYSFENTIHKFFSKPSIFTNVTRFETRSIYSEEAREDDVVDNYRIFLANSFYDLPKHTGEIWDSFVSNNTLYLHTPKCLWRAFFNDTVQEANDIGETIMGTGGVFSLPAKEVLTAKGGYAGTISQYGGTHTPYGYVFPDALQGKIFILGQGLSEISTDISRYISDNLSSGLVSGSTYTDNPSNPASVGIISVYDFDRKRFVITKRGTIDFTLSASLLNPSEPTWLSYHSYTPHLYFAINNGMFGFSNSGATTVMHEHNVGDYGVYYGAAVQPFTLEYIINHSPNVEKAMDNLFIYSEAYNNANFLELETFKSLQCTTTKKDTGLVTLTCTNLFNDNSNVKKKRDRFQIAVPRNSLGINPMFRDRMKGEWMRVRLSYPNASNYKLLVNFINSELRPVSR